jgi:hypothetical protein
VCWVTLFGLVAYDVSSLAQGQSANLINGNTSGSQTIDSITSNNTQASRTALPNNDHSNPNDPNDPKEIITPITKGRNNRTGITIHNNIIMHVRAQKQCP